MSKIKKIDYFKLSNYFYKTTIIIVTIIGFWLLFFLYNNVYSPLTLFEKTKDSKTMDNSKNIKIEKERLKQILINIERKNEIKDLTKEREINNPFKNEESNQQKDDSLILEKPTAETEINTEISTF